MMRAPRFWDRDVDPKSREGAPLTRLLLTPAAMLYAEVTRRRIAKADPTRLSIPVICIGNLSAGGSGKSPVAVAIRDRLSAAFPAKRIATLSRGYGGSEKGPLQVDFTSHSAASVGDEALMFSKTGEAWIGADRALAGQAIEADGVDLIIMDDGHQNPGLHKDLSLVVVDGHAVFGNGKVIPKGPLREPVEEGLARADGIILMGAASRPEELDAVRLPILNAALVPATSKLDSEFVAFAGIGRPEKFFDTLTACGASLADAVPFPDHHAYSARDLRYLHDLSRERNAPLITTEKDLARLSPDARDGILTLPVTAEFENWAELDHLLKPVTDRLGEAG